MKSEVARCRFDRGPAFVRGSRSQHTFFASIERELIIEQTPEAMAHQNATHGPKLREFEPLNAQNGTHYEQHYDDSAESIVISTHQERKDAGASGGGI